MKKDDKGAIFKIRISSEDRDIMNKLAEKHSLSIAGMIRMLIRAEWRNMGGR